MLHAEGEVTIAANQEVGVRDPCMPCSCMACSSVPLVPCMPFSHSAITSRTGGACWCMHEALLLRCCRYIPVNNLGSFQKAGQRKDFRLRAEQTLMQVWGRWRTERIRI